jgi:hypothetical protein
LLNAVQLLHIRAGEISTRRIAAAAGPGEISHNTVSKVLKAPHDCKLLHLRAVVRVLNGDEEQFECLWEQARLKVRQHRPAGPESTVPQPAMTTADPSSGGPTGPPVTVDDRREPPARTPPERPTGAIVPARAYPRTAYRPLADELFLISHDRRRGRTEVGKHLAFGLAAAALGELLLAGYIDVTPRAVTVLPPPTVAPPGDVEPDPVTGYFLQELADEAQRRTLTLNDWVKGTAEETCRRVVQRLAEAGIVERHRRWGRLYYPRTSIGQLISPDVRVTGYLLQNLTPPDLQTRFLISLICAIDAENALVVDLTDRQLRERAEPVSRLLPPAMQAILGAVEKTIWGRALIPTL